ncbi:MAG TPA: metallophosphoesterase [Bacteroidota bacterium]|nr:metallophosphoesterase [Bacteroidota bacterium]
MQLKNLTNTLALILLPLLSFTGGYAPLQGAPSPGSSAGAASPGEKPLTFLVISDWGRDGINDTDKKTPGQLSVARQLGITAGNVGASFVVSCGDNFHGQGVSDPADPLWKVNFEQVYTAGSLKVPWYIALGNHDYEGNVEAELAYASMSARWIQPARYFAFTREVSGGNTVLFVVLDSSPFVREYLKDERDQHHVRGQNTALQIQWCDSVLSHSQAKWKFAFFHHPAYSAGTKHGSTLEIQQALVPLFEKYHVDACFSGHDHDLQHSHPDGSTVEYFGTGGGSETRPSGHADFTRYSAASLGFGVVSVTGDAMRFRFVSDRGKVLYRFDIRK